MLERLRHHPRLHSWVLGLFAALWLTALFSGAQVRAVLPLLGGPGAAASMAEMGYCGMAPSLDELRAWFGQEPPADADGPANAHTPACLLCIAMAAPGPLRLPLYRPPLLGALPLLGNPDAPLHGWLAQAPLPARGPPLLHG